MPPSFRGTAAGGGIPGPIFLTHVAAVVVAIGVAARAGNETRVIDAASRQVRTNADTLMSTQQYVPPWRYGRRSAQSCAEPKEAQSFRRRTARRTSSRRIATL